jgi:hypothetical protein
MKTLLVAAIVLLAGGCMVHETDRYYVRDGNRVYGSSAPVADHQLVCHKGKKTLSLPPSAVDAHMGHGDRRGPC